MSENICPPTRHYFGIDRDKVEWILRALRAEGYDVRGRNPWTFDTRRHGVELRGTWFEDEARLQIEVLAKKWYVPCRNIWSTVDRHIAGLENGYSVRP